MNRTRVFLLMAVLAVASDLILPQKARPVDRTVPDPYAEIGDAIVASSTGDRVLVSPRLASYAAFTLNKSIQVLPAPGAGEVTVSGSGSTYAARITASGGSISGLTLQGGSQAVVDLGPGQLVDCVVRDLGSTYDRGLVKVLDTGGSISGCTFTRTSLTNCATIVIGVMGGDVEISGNSFESAHEDYGELDYLIEVGSGSLGDVAIHDNTIVFTASASYGTGIGLFEDGAQIADNWISGPFCGIECAASATIHGNIVEMTGYGDCGIYLDTQSSSSIEENTLVDDSGPDATGIWVAGTLGYHALERNLFYGMNIGVYYGFGLSVDQLYHNIYDGASQSSN